MKEKKLQKMLELLDSMKDELYNEQGDYKYQSYISHVIGRIELVEEALNNLK